MQVALKDLEIRGAGNLLGGEQSGHIAGVGFDLYLRMIGEAVSTFRGEVAEGQTELRLELPVDAHIPEEYVESERLRLEAYQKLSAASSPASAPEAIDLVLEELTDRYGEPPAEVREPDRGVPAAADGAEGGAQRGRHRRWAAAGRRRRAGRTRSRCGCSGCSPGPATTPRRSRCWCRCRSSTARRLDDAGLIEWTSGLLTAIYAGQPAAVAPPVP